PGTNNEDDDCLPNLDPPFTPLMLYFNATPSGPFEYDAQFKIFELDSTLVINDNPLANITLLAHGDGQSGPGGPSLAAPPNVPW
ncbi:MAG: hypothetical protein QGI45_17305, partial [Myxococcota bacterium]|nr:hypothetical protein [Myxococcota bacterium]